MSEYQVGPETFVTLGCQVFDAEGEAASDRDVIAFVFGLGGLLPGLELALEGKQAGDSVRVTLPPERAYGHRAAGSVLEVDRSDFPESVAVGDRFEVENAEGGVLVVHVLDVQDEVVVIDTNHPLAEQDVEFLMEIQEVRPATQEEIRAAEALLADDAESLQIDVPPISPAALIRGGARR